MLSRANVRALDTEIMVNSVTQLGHIGILMGGYSSEREVSLKSGNAVYGALKECGCHVSSLDIVVKNKGEIESLLKESGIHVAFIALHGRLGEDGTIQEILENAQIAYTGSRVEASRKAINKVISQKVFKENNIPVADFRVLHKKRNRAVANLLKELDSLPLVVKPAEEGSSIGISIVREKSELRHAINIAFKYGPEILLERYVKGRELTVGIIDETPLPAIEIKPKEYFFNYTAKYQEGRTEYIVPAKIPEKLSNQLKSIALMAHKALGCEDFSRVDFMLDEDSNPFVLEVNTIPGFTSTSLLPKAAKLAGMNFTKLCLKLIELAYEKEK